MAEPFILVMPERATWEWKAANVCTDAVAWAVFAEQAENRDKLWAPPAAPVTSIKLPRLLNLPAVVAKFLTEKERTAYEAYKFVLSVVAEDESGVTTEDAVLISSWFMAVGQCISGTDTQALPLEFQPVTSIDANFHKWAHNHASQYLGEKPQATEAVAPQPAQASIADAESVLMGVTTVLQNIAGSQHKALLEVTKKSEESKPYDEWDIAALMGYCNVSSPDEVPAIWPKLKVTKKAVDQRAAIVNAMEQWSFEERKEIDTAFFLSKDVLEDILKIQPNDTNTVGLNSTTGRGVSNLAVLPRRMAEIEMMLRMEEAADKSELTRTMKEAEKMAKVETRAPPRTYYTLKLNVATYAALVFVLYGRRCDLYRKLIAIYKIMCAREVVVCRDAFLPLICKQITWAIYDDSRSFFATRLLPDHFQQRNIPFPFSLLNDIYNSVRYINEIKRPTFPTAWLENNKPTNNELETQGGYPMSHLSPHGNGAGNQRGRGGGGRDNQNNANRDQYAAPNPQEICDLFTFSPKMKASLKHFHEKFKGKVSIQRVMNAAGIWWPQMPKWDRYYNRETNQDELCWNQVIGCCRFGSECKFARSHAEARKLPSDFEDNAIKHNNSSV
jgi:hypothetical protein